MTKRILHFDYETRSTCDLRAEGVYRYVENPTTEIILMAYGFDEGPIKLWYPIWGEKPPQDFIDGLLDPECVLAGHNSVGFEHKLTVITGRKYFPKEVIEAVKPYSRWTCTAIRAAAAGLPRDLDGASVALRLKEKKDKEGYHLMLTMCKPLGYDKQMKPYWKEDRDSIIRLGQYCAVDVIVEREMDKKLPELSAWEHRVWMATERMSDRGIAMDGPLVHRMAEIVKAGEEAAHKRINQITNGRVPKITNTKKLNEWLNDNNIEVENVAKNTLKDLLNAHAKFEEEMNKAGFDVSQLSDEIVNGALPSHVKEVLLIRRDGGKSSAGKYKAALSRVNKDNRCRGSMRYCGAASTSRFSSTGLQLQNLNRGNGIEIYNETEKKIKDKPLDIEAAIESILAGATIEDIERDFGPPLIVASDLVRPSFIARPEHLLARGDYSQIEARVSCLIGNQLDTLQAYVDYDTIIGYDDKGKEKRKGYDLYLLTAAKVLSVLRGKYVDPNEVTKAERQTFGKVADLACGFGGGKGAYLAFARLYGVHISEEEANEIVVGYRGANRGKAAAWKTFERAAFDCLKGEPGEIHWCATRPEDDELLDWQGNPVFGDITIPRIGYFKRNNKCMILKMPSGGQIIYWYPKLERKMMPWGKERDCITYYAQDSQKKYWRQFTAYGGLLFQNFVQRYARDVAANGLVLLDERKLNPVMMVHDELIAEIPLIRCNKDPKIAAELVRDCMLNRASWLDPKLPLAVEASAGPRYVKG